jgi:hypothetical protein
MWAAQCEIHCFAGGQVKVREPCDYFDRPKGCRNGDSCGFLHGGADTRVYAPLLCFGCKLPLYEETAEANHVVTMSCCMQYFHSDCFWEKRNTLHSLSAACPCDCATKGAQYGQFGATFSWVAPLTRKDALQLLQRQRINNERLIRQLYDRQLYPSYRQLSYLALHMYILDELRRRGWNVPVHPSEHRRALCPWVALAMCQSRGKASLHTLQQACPGLRATPLFGVGPLCPMQHCPRGLTTDDSHGWISHHKAGSLASDVTDHAVMTNKKVSISQPTTLLAINPNPFAALGEETDEPDNEECERVEVASEEGEGSVGTTAENWVDFDPELQDLWRAYANATLRAAENSALAAASSHH